MPFKKYVQYCIYTIVRCNCLKKILYISTILIVWSCHTRQSDNLGQKWKNEILDTTQNLLLFKDYDVFERKGIEKLERGKIDLPFIQVFSQTDTTVVLRVYENDLMDYEEAIIPLVEGVKVNRSYDYMDNPNVIYGTISGNRIMRYGYYNNDPYHLDRGDSSVYLHEIIPHHIEVISRDTIKSLYYLDYVTEKFGVDVNDNGQFETMKGKIVFPFQVDIDYKNDFKELSDVLSFTVITETDSTLIYQDYFKHHDSVTTNEPFIIPKKFRRWRSHLNPIRGM
jgi:hypothetical protein